MSEMMKLEAEDPGGLRVVPGIPVGSTSELEQTQDSKDLMFPDFQIVVVKEEHCDLWSSNSDQQDPEPLDIKEEDEELWINQEVEQLLVKIEDEEKPQLSELHQIKTENDRKTEAPTSSSTEQMETESNEENCGGPEPDTNRDPECSYQQSKMTVHKKGQLQFHQDWHLEVCMTTTPREASTLKTSALQQLTSDTSSMAHLIASVWSVGRTVRGPS
ncbi:uncharacterized protein LOC124875352 isoform X3 [Girardinichthys multiradiatus]|uniref:uncharacterized protein LOC124875352 isoform X3 n=1 Tax=Girardinichthys multiradiatus TaxID=208333 RepID=UPI001FAC4681|nr:uncharacterized protein LOC124875352 isoform X3 [Girardinichthys multiradiatus]